jgi:hypothetical protein
MSFTGGDSDLKATVRLPTDVKTISAVQLMGYRINGLDTEPHAALYIREVATNNNTLLCNHEHISGAFYVCSCAGLTSTGAFYDDAMHYDPNGLRCQEFDARKIPQLTFELKRVTTSPLEQQAISKPSGTDHRLVQLWLQIRVECD